MHIIINAQSFVWHNLQVESGKSYAYIYNIGTYNYCIHELVIKVQKILGKVL